MVSSHSAKEEIKRTADIVELIGQFVQLKKAGRNYVGLCPFHAEKAPSFTVSPERQTFHCFGCKKGGDIFSFWMEYHNATFLESLRDLAERYQVTISDGFSAAAERKKASQREAIYTINEAAATFFEKILWHQDKGRIARDYLKKRSVSKDMVSEFRLGYAPDEWQGLVEELRRLKLDLDLAVQAGVVIPRKGGGYYDRFRGRIVFPISDLRQKVVGFGGRVLDDTLPKYLNSPETLVFHKGEFLYGLHASFRAIKEKQRAVIVEGYMDCIALRKYGLKEVVATLGTALTTRQVRKLKGYASEALVVFDSDEAGKAAALKSLPVFSNEGLSAKAVVLPDGCDPDSFVNQNGLKQFLKLLDQASTIFDFYLEQTIPQGHVDVEEKIRTIKEILPFLSGLHSETQRSLYAQRISERLGIKEGLVLSELSEFLKSGSSNALGKGITKHLTKQKAEKSINDVQQLNLLLHYPQTAERLMAAGCKILLSDPAIIEIVDAIFDRLAKNGQYSLENMADSLTTESARIQFREALAQKSFYSEWEVELALAEIERKAHQKNILDSFRRAREMGDNERLVQLTKLKAEGQPKS